MGLFLDFDGTLVDIAPTPDSIEVPPRLAAQLAALQRLTDGAVAIVTGRDVADIERHLPDFDGPIAGGHGSHFRTPDGNITTINFDADRLVAIKRKLAGFAKTVNGLHVEDKTAGCVLHYRQAPDAGRDAHDFVGRLLEGQHGFVAEAAKMAVEIRSEDINKASAVASLAADPPFEGRVPVFAGDDTSDEPAFQWVNMNGGHSIRVGQGPTAAQFAAASPGELALWIDSLIAALENE
jgi:trehalose 6-phosphate phosphatase